MTKNFQPKRNGNFQKNNQNRPMLSPEEYKAKKAAERNEVFGLLDEATEQVMSDPAVLESFLDTQSRFDRYSTSNTLLIHCQRPDATQIKDFEGWAKDNIRINKGESSFAILEPVPAEDGSNKVFYNVKRVFDVSQTNSNRRQPAQSVNRNPKDALIAMLDTAPVEVETVDSFMYSDTIAEYNNDAGKLSVRRGVNDEVKLFQSVALELAFAELSVNSKSYDRREFTFAAVCTANMLCKKFGVPAERFKITELPPSWQEKDVKAVRAELSKIRQATSGICSRVNEELYRQRQAKTPEREPRSGGRDR
ncbi:LtrC-like protein [uncultured Ruminococcus sp.]|uniref:LtrC-like protein n=1 Tax=uncultured Ruminococcus sp. TaxID=165186 RepID=UPI0029304DB1|nr:LtrC-like protein [uncultured Ruminococcus sp.]